MTDDVLGASQGRNGGRQEASVSGGAQEGLGVSDRTSEPPVRGRVLDFRLPPRPPVALTFDDGPSEWTEQILDVLAEHRVPATFFVVGEHVAGREDTLRRAVGLGCELANHTFSHANLSVLSRDETFTELADTSTVLLAATRRAPYCYRAPFLHDTPEARVCGLALGMISVDCDVIAEDWAEPDADAIYGRVMAGVENGGRIVLLHDGVPPDRDGNRQPTVDCVKRLVPDLARRFSLVTVSDLLIRQPNAA